MPNLKSNLKKVVDNIKTLSKYLNVIYNWLKGLKLFPHTKGEAQEHPLNKPLYSMSCIILSTAMS